MLSAIVKGRHYTNRTWFSDIALDNLHIDTVFKFPVNFFNDHMKLVCNHRQLFQYFFDKFKGLKVNSYQAFSSLLIVFVSG